MESMQTQAAVNNSWRALFATRTGSLRLAATVAVLAVAVVLRFYGLSWDAGFPYTPHPDERAILMNVGNLATPPLDDLGSLLDADESPWNPRWFPYGSLPLYLLKGIQMASKAVTGDSLDDLRLAGRVLSAAADVATVAGVLLLGSAAYGRRAGLLAAAFAALAVIHIQLSHFYAVDTLLAMFTVAALFFLYRVALQGRARDSVVAGVLIGFGLATKMSQAPIYVAFIVAHLMYVLGASDRAATAPLAQRIASAAQGMIAGGAASLAAMFLAEPYAFLDKTRFWADFTEQSEMVRRIRDYPYTRQYIDTTAYWYQARQLATWGLGWPLGIVAWAGLVHAALRGIGLRRGTVYLAAGMVVPGAILLVSDDTKAIMLATGIAAAALLATLPMRPRNARVDVLLLSWVVPYLLIVGAFDVKFLRYMLPVTPFLLLFGARMLTDLWEVVSGWRPATRPWLLGALAMLLAATGFYALSFTTIYGRPHTAVRASEWINENAPPGSVVLKEHWEEGLPGMGRYQIRELPMYEPDGSAKTQLLAEELAGADYLVFFSNRLYGTLPRLPERYFVSGAYYRLLFAGALGYEVVDTETSFPGIGGVRLVDDTFARPGLPDPSGGAAAGGALSLSLGSADESFTVYDHPRVMVLENRGRLDAVEIRRLIEEATPPRSLGDTAAAASRGTGLMLSPEDAAVQQAGGTWTDIVDQDGWTNRLPVVAWLVVVEGIAILALPIAFLVFRPLPDRGYLLAKPLGILAVSLVVWLLASLRWMQFTGGSIAVALLLLAAASAAVLARHRAEIVGFIRRRWRLLLVAELVFLAAFLAFVAIRMANPDLWHPFRGGEKPMDLAYLNAVLRSSIMPPYDPWFAGGYLNYYYWGQFVVAVLIKATGIHPWVAFNLAVPLMFALTVGGAYTLVYNLAEATRRKGDASTPGNGARIAWSPVLAGVGAGVFVAVLGNLDGAIQLGQGAWRELVQELPFGAFDFWRSSRMMAPDPPGWEITEFPFFTFLFADLHAHMMALPFSLLALGAGLATVLGASRRAGEDGGRLAEIGRLVVLGLAVGSLRAINAWDYPTYLAMAVAAVLVAGFLRHGGIALSMVVESAARSAFVVAVGYLAFLPFLLNYETFFNSVEATTNQTVLWQFLAIHGVFVFIIGSFLLVELVQWRRLAPDAVARLRRAAGRGRSPAGVLVALGLAGLVAAFVLATAAAGVQGSTVPFVAALLAAVVAVAVGRMSAWRPDSPAVLFVAAMVAVALSLAIGLDVVRVEGDIDRMNSVFKFYLHIWTLLALSAAYLLWRLAHGRRLAWRALGPGAQLWVAALALLLAGASVYPVLGTRARLADRFDGMPPFTLEGAAYARTAVYSDPNGTIDLARDFEGIEWLLNLEGSPVVLEAVTPTYRWGSRVSIYTGLPTVVGWQWHQEQQRWDYRREVQRRIDDVDRIYRTTNVDEAMSLLARYDVEYIYVGQVERLYYPGEGLVKFDGSTAGRLEKVFEADRVAIYKVLGD